MQRGGHFLVLIKKTLQLNVKTAQNH